MSWKLSDAVQAKKKHGGTGYLPSAKERNALEPGMFAELVFVQKTPRASQAIWVEVMTVHGPGKYEGVIASAPTQGGLEGLDFGNVVRFEAKHVYAIEDRGAAFHPNPTNYSMNGMFDAFEIWRSDQPRPEVTINEEDIWYYAAPEEVKKRTRGRGPAQSPSSSIFSRPGEGQGADRPDSASPKDWSPNRPSRFGSRPSSGFNRPRGDESGYEGRGERD